jgi:hypothetical protein
MPDLEMLLRDVRPVPDGAWTQRLDARVAARFPGPQPRWKTALEKLRLHFLAISAVGAVSAMVIALIAAGVSYDGGGDSENADKSAPEAMSGTAATPPAQSRSGASAAKRDSSGFSAPVPSSAAPDSPLTAQRQVRSSATITLSCPTDEVATVTDRAIRTVDGLGGFVQTSEVSSVGSNAGSTLTLKVPSARLETALSQLSRLAHVKARSQESEDLTDQKAALEARVRDVANLNREVSYATVSLEIQGTRKPGAGSGPATAGEDHWTPGDAIKDAGRVLEVIAGVLVIALAILLPIGLIVVVIALLSRVFVRRARERALEMA